MRSSSVVNGTRSMSKVLDPNASILGALNEVLAASKREGWQGHGTQEGPKDFAAMDKTDLANRLRGLFEPVGQSVGGDSRFTAQDRLDLAARLQALWDELGLISDADFFALSCAENE